MMKRLICIITVLALFFGLIPTAFAAEKPAFSGDCSASIQWELDASEGILTISGTGAMPDYSYGNAPWYLLRSRIFSAVLSDDITSIGAFAFNECSRLTSIKAGTLDSIGKCAMNNCIILDSIEFTAADTLDIGADAFFGCEAITELKINAKIGVIGKGAFSGCVKLKEISLPDSLQRLEEDTFSGCEALETLSVPKDLSYIGKNCFRGCLALTDLTLPESLAEVGQYAFQGCPSIHVVFTKDAPAFANADDLSASFPSSAVLHIPFDAKDWEWPIYRGYNTEYIFPNLEDVFHDLEKNAWYLPSIQHVYYLGLMNGIRDGEFAPKNAMTRAQLVTVLYRMADEPEVQSENPFSDIKTSAYYYDAVRWAQKNNIVTGLTSTTFGPDAKVSRQQMCTILYRYAAFLDLDLSVRDTLQDFSDVAKLASYARDPMGWCVAMKFINGKPGAKLDPDGTATRAEIAKVLAAFDTFLAKQEILSRDDWKEEYKDPEVGPDIDREDPLYLYAREVLDAINKTRISSGLSALQWNDYLFEAAQTRAEELAGENGFSHTRPDGSNYSTVFTQYGITCNTRNEIIAHGYTSAQSLVDVWSTAPATSPVINAVVYSSAAVGVFQTPPTEESPAGKYHYVLLVIG